MPDSVDMGAASAGLALHRPTDNEQWDKWHTTRSDARSNVRCFARDPDDADYLTAVLGLDPANETALIAYLTEPRKDTPAS